MIHFHIWWLASREAGYKAQKNPQLNRKAGWYCIPDIFNTRSERLQKSCCWNCLVMAQADMLQHQPSKVFRSEVSFCSSNCQGFKSAAFLNACTLLYCPIHLKKRFGGIDQENMVRLPSREPSQGWRKEKSLAADFAQLTTHPSNLSQQFSLIIIKKGLLLQWNWMFFSSL